MKSVALLFEYLLLYNKSKLVDKTAFIMEAFIGIFTALSSIFVFQTIIDKIGIIEGWSKDELIFYYTMALCLFYLGNALFGLSLYFLDSMIMRGELDVYITKPNSLIGQVMSRNIHFFYFMGFFIQLGLAVFSYIKCFNEISIMRLVYFLIACIGIVCLYASFYISFMGCAFLIPKIGMVRGIVLDLKCFVQYPLTIFPRIIRYVLIGIFPMAAALYVPSMILLHKPIEGYMKVIAIAHLPICLMCLRFSIWFFYRMLKSYYVSSGG